jgi:hypothetical protein
MEALGRFHVDLADRSDIHGTTSLYQFNTLALGHIITDLIGPN